MCGEDSSVMEQEGSKSKSRRVRLMVSRYGQEDDDDDVMILMIYDVILMMGPCYEL